MDFGRGQGRLTGLPLPHPSRGEVKAGGGDARLISGIGGGDANEREPIDQSRDEEMLSSFLYEIELPLEPARTPLRRVAVNFADLGVLSTPVAGDEEAEEVKLILARPDNGRGRPRPIAPYPLIGGDVRSALSIEPFPADKGRARVRERSPSGVSDAERYGESLFTRCSCLRRIGVGSTSLMGEAGAGGARLIGSGIVGDSSTGLVLVETGSAIAFKLVSAGSSSASSTSARTESCRVIDARLGIPRSMPKPRPSSDGRLGKPGQRSVFGSASSREDHPKPLPLVELTDEELVSDARDGSEVSNVGLKLPVSGERRFESTDRVSTTSSNEGSAISACGDGSRMESRFPTKASSAFRRDSSFDLSASAPRPEGSNFSLDAFTTGLIRAFCSGPVGEHGDEGKLGEEIPKEVGRPTLRFGREIDDDRE